MPFLIPSLLHPLVPVHSPSFFPLPLLYSLSSSLLPFPYVSPLLFSSYLLLYLLLHLTAFHLPILTPSLSPSLFSPHCSPLCPPLPLQLCFSFHPPPPPPFSLYPTHLPRLLPPPLCFLSIAPCSSSPSLSLCSSPLGSRDPPVLHTTHK